MNIFFSKRCDEIHQGSDIEYNNISAVIQNCRKGDIVIFCWNKEHQQYKIIQNSPTLYFVHGESLSGLKLKNPPKDTASATAFFYGVVTNKEHCLAKKVLLTTHLHKI